MKLLLLSSRLSTNQGSHTKHTSVARPRLTVFRFGIFEKDRDREMRNKRINPKFQLSTCFRIVVILTHNARPCNVPPNQMVLEIWNGNGFFIGNQMFRRPEHAYQLVAKLNWNRFQPKNLSWCSMHKRLL